jgi:hypothetical protein
MLLTAPPAHRTKNLPNAGAQDLRFARAGAGNHHHRAFHLVYRPALVFIQALVFFFKLLQQFFATDSHKVKVKCFAIVFSNVDKSLRLLKPDDCMHAGLF